MGNNPGPITSTTSVVIYDGRTHVADDRLGFGENWSRFLTILTPARIQEAEASLRQMLGIVADLTGGRFWMLAEAVCSHLRRRD